MNSKEQIKKLNPQLFPPDGTILAPKDYELVLVTREITKENENGDKVKVLTFKHTTSPTQKALDAGVTKDQYFRAFMNPTGIRKEGADGSITIRSKKKAPPHNIFARTQTLLYDEINALVEEYEKEKDLEKKTQILKEKFRYMGKTQGDYGTGANKQAKYRINNVTITGLQIAMNVPKYKVHRIDENGDIVPLTSTRRDSKGNYKSGEPVTLSVFRFWADEDDLEELAETCVRHYENSVQDYETGETITTTRKSNEETTKVESPKVDEKTGGTSPEDNVEEE